MENSQKDHINNDWSIVYETAIDEDGKLFFPERLSLEFLEKAKRTQGTYIFANQYLNEIFPSDAALFKKDWFRYFPELPSNIYTFGFIDPAISTEDGADYTGIVICAVDSDANWYILLADRKRMTPTEIINYGFTLAEHFNLMGLGIETVAYQKALMYMFAEEMGRRQRVIPIKEYNPGPMRTKEMRIMSLIPRFEFGKVFLKPGLDHLEHQLLQFPRGKNDDIIDAMSSLENIIFYPTKEKINEQIHPTDPRYESRFIQTLVRRANENL